VTNASRVFTPYKPMLCNHFYYCADLLGVSRFVNQTLSNRLRQANIRALAVSHFAAVVAVIKLREIQRQMLCADMMENAHYSALEQGKIPLNAGRRHHVLAFVTAVFARAMLH
jgi:hypothetical protein